MMRLLILLVACALASPAAAEGGGFTFSAPDRSSYPPQYPYPNEPQYQYPSNSRAQQKCPKGQAPFQGRCRIKLPVR
jgi:hypothetical protein